MKRYTIQQRIEILKIHYKNGESVAETVRKTRTFLGRREAPSRTAIQKLIEKFELSGQVRDVKNKTRARRSRTAENIAAVAESIEENPGLSIPRRSLQLGIPQTSLHRILHKDLGLNVSEVQLISKENELVSDDDSSITGPTTKKRKTQNYEINLPEAPMDEPHPLQNKNNKEKQPVGGKKGAGPQYTYTVTQLKTNY